MSLHDVMGHKAAYRAALLRTPLAPPGLIIHPLDDALPAILKNAVSSAVGHAQRDVIAVFGREPGVCVPRAAHEAAAAADPEAKQVEHALRARAWRDEFLRCGGDPSLAGMRPTGRNQEQIQEQRGDS